MINMLIEYWWTETTLNAHNKLQRWKANRGQTPSTDEYIDRNRAFEITICFLLSTLNMLW